MASVWKSDTIIYIGQTEPWQPQQKPVWRLHVEGRWALGGRGPYKKSKRGSREKPEGRRRKKRKMKTKFPPPFPLFRGWLSTAFLQVSDGGRELGDGEKEVFSYWGLERRRPLVNGRKTDNLPREKVRKKSFIVYRVLADRANAPFPIMTLLFSINPRSYWRCFSAKDHRSSPVASFPFAQLRGRSYGKRPFLARILSSLSCEGRGPCQKKMAELRRTGVGVWKDEEAFV